MAFGLPKPAELKAMFDEKFGMLVDKLDEILAELKKLNAKEGK
jgi:hypothetical protein